MAFDVLRLLVKVLFTVVPYAGTLLGQRLYAVYHRFTYTALPNDSAELKNVVVIGGSFAGLQLVRRLCETLPTGFRVVLIEKHSHFHFSWAFPRFAVVPGLADTAFIPYPPDDAGAYGPRGVFRRICGEVVEITPDYIKLASREEVAYAVLAIATGTTQLVPSKVSGAAELRAFQKNVEKAKCIAVLGGGAVGVELATDIKSVFPEKAVTLIHSRKQLLPSYSGLRLHTHVHRALAELGVEVVYNERPEILPGNKGLRTSKGVEEFDLIVPCTGQRPNSGLLKELAPEAISKESGHILVHATLQILANSDLSNIFALGDVAATGGPKMSRASAVQADVVVDNILDLIRRREPKKAYIPQRGVEGAIRLTLGRKKYLMYLQEEDGSDILVTGKGGDDFKGVVKRAWRWVGVKFNQ